MYKKTSKKYIKSGFRDIDHTINGWEIGKLTILAVSDFYMPEKFSYSMFKNLCFDTNTPTYLSSFSWYVNFEKKKLCSLILKTPLEIQHKDLSLVLPHYKEKLLLNSSLIIGYDEYDEDIHLSFFLAQFKIKCQKLKREKKIKLIILRLNHILSGDLLKSNNYNEIKNKSNFIVNNLTEISLELGISIILFVNLNHYSKKNINRPTISKLEKFIDLDLKINNVNFIYSIEDNKHPIDRDVVFTTIEHKVIARFKYEFDFKKISDWPIQ